jgi:protein tyrosine/serine phosphatase
VKSNIFIAHAGAVAWFLLSSSSISAGPHQGDNSTSSLSKHSIGTRQKAAGIDGFAEVTPRLYRGGQPDLKAIETLKKMGIDIVVNMRGGRNRYEEAEVKMLGMQYFSISWHCPFPRDKPFARFLKLIEDNPGKKVFVHCRLGDDRTGMAVAAYRMAEQGWSAEEAMNEMKAFGFTRTHHWICPGLAPYERRFPKRLKTAPAFKDLCPHSTPAK